MDWNKCIFMAHAAEDKPAIQKIYKLMKDRGLEPWLDEKSLQPGSNWESEIRTAIQNARFFIAFLSSKSVQKNGFVQKEFRMALNELEKKSPNNTYFIPALLDDIALPDIRVGTINLRDYHAVNLFDLVAINNLIDYLSEEIKVNEPQTGPFQLSFERIKVLVSENETSLALQELMSITKENNLSYHNNVLLLNSRFKQVKNGHNLGIIPSEEYFFGINKINFSLLEIIELIQNR
jgi:hypothetical protein